MHTEQFIRFIFFLMVLVYSLLMLTSDSLFWNFLPVANVYFGDWRHMNILLRNRWEENWMCSLTANNKEIEFRSRQKVFGTVFFFFRQEYKACFFSRFMVDVYFLSKILLTALLRWTDILMYKWDCFCFPVCSANIVFRHFPFCIRLKICLTGVHLPEDPVFL